MTYRAVAIPIAHASVVGMILDVPVRHEVTPPQG